MNEYTAIRLCKWDLVCDLRGLFGLKTIACKRMAFHGSATTVPTESEFCHWSVLENYEEKFF
jgi:hypothetical protein